jgi:hypothetical protein
MATKPSTPAAAAPAAQSAFKLSVAVLDRGWVFIGRIIQHEGGVKLENAACIRRWGTTKGVGELALHGPQPSTVLDEAGTVIVPSSSVICLIETTEEVWPGR